MSQSLLKALPQYFGDISRICGTEKTFHAALFYHLRRQGFQVAQLHRSRRLNQHTMDLIITAHDDPECITDIVELKGGAYGNRSALAGYASEERTIPAIDKLRRRPPNSHGWFACVDLPELGLAMGRRELDIAIGHARKDELGFIYFDASRSDFTLHTPDGSETVTTIEPGVAHASTVAGNNCLEASIASLAESSAVAKGSEDTYLCQLYSALRTHGITAQQVALETYFTLACNGEHKMQLRPDLTTFDRGIDGRFNLYPNGDTSRTNDPIKLQHLRLVVELKGSVALDKQSDNKVASAYQRDVVKLKKWRQLIHNGIDHHKIIRHDAPRYVFIAVDNRRLPLAQRLLESLSKEAEQSDVEFNYIHRGQVVVAPSIMQWRQ